MPITLQPIVKAEGAKPLSQVITEYSIDVGVSLIEQTNICDIAICRAYAAAHLVSNEVRPGE